MNCQLLRNVWRVIPALVLGFAGAGAMAQDHKVVDGITIYLGVAPGSAIAPAERRMHGGIPPAPSQFHVMVALFDATSGQRITDAVVRARVSGDAGTSREEVLEPMPPAESITYGNYFTMPEPGTYKVLLGIYRPSLSHVVEARLDYKR